VNLYSAFRTFWGCHISQFDDSKHCQACFARQSDREKIIARTMSISKALHIQMRGNYFYICGVSKGFPISSDPASDYMKNNFHMPVAYCKGSRAVMHTYKGHKFVLDNAELLEIDPKYAYERYANLDPEYVECRNFQFGVQYFCTKQPEFGTES
jgi:hypothetical protein